MIGFKKDKFRLIDKLPINYNDIALKYGWSSDYRKGNQALLGLLEHKETKQKLIVVSTHFHWNPNLDFVKYAQGVWLMRSISKFLKAHDLAVNDAESSSGDHEKADDLTKQCNIPLIISGDFNSKPSSTLIHLMNNRRVDTNDLGELVKLEQTYLFEENRNQFL